MNMLLGSALLSAAGASAVAQNNPVENPLGGFWADEKNEPMDRCVAEFSFEQKAFELWPPMSGQKTKVTGFVPPSGEDRFVMKVFAHGKSECSYECILTKDDTVICTNVGKV